MSKGHVSDVRMARFNAIVWVKVNSSQQGMNHGRSLSLVWKSSPLNIVNIILPIKLLHNFMTYMWMYISMSY